MRQLFTRRNIIISLLATVCIISFLGFYIYKNIWEAVNEAQRIDQSLQSLRSLEDLMNDMQDIETGQRGYAITGDPGFLGPYNKGKSRLRQDIANLQKLIRLQPYRSA